MSSTAFLALLMVTFACIGFVLAMVMGRLGHSPYAWGLLGLLIGPIALLLALVEVDTSTAGREQRVRLQGELERQAEVVRAWLGERDGSVQPEQAVVPELKLMAGRPATTLDTVAADDGYDLLVVGVRGAGLSKVLLGSVASRLAARASVPVLVVGDRARPGRGERRLRSVDQADPQGQP